MPIHRHPLLLRSYAFLPHRALGAAVARMAQVRSPQPAVQAAISFWAKRGGIDLAECAGEPWPTLQDFFLRDLAPGARPQGSGLTSPVDGVVVAAESIASDRMLRIKGRPVGLHRLLGGKTHQLDLAQCVGGTQVTIFLTPDGYHHVHAPCDGELQVIRWIAGRFFPQNDDALRHIARVYERNERATLTFASPDKRQWHLSMVAASLVGSIVLDGRDSRGWRTAQATQVADVVTKGQRLGHFALGSTVVLVFPRDTVTNLQVQSGQRVKLGETLADWV